MKLHYISRSFLPSDMANSVHVTKMCNALAGLSVDVTLRGRRGEGSGSFSALAELYGLSHPFELSLSRLRRGRALKYYPKVSAWKARLSGADGVLTRCPRSGERTALLGIPTLIELHFPPEEGRAVQKAFKRALDLPALRGVIVISEQLAARIREEYEISPGLVHVLHDGADPIPDATEPAPHEGRPRIGYLGSITPGKGVETILEIAPHLPEADFVIVGGSADEIDAWRNSTDAPNLVFEPRIPHAEVPGKLQSFDIALLPNGDFIPSGENTRNIAPWTSPLKAFEYMAAGRPVVSSNAPNLAEIFRDNETACLRPINDLSAWVETLRDLIADPERRVALGRAAKKDFEARFTWEARARYVVDLLRQESGGKSPSPRR